MGPIEATKLYRQALDGFQKNAAAGTSGQAEQSDFLNMVRDVSNESVTSMKSAEKMSVEAVTGKAELSDVAVAVAHAESTLKTMVTVRDKMIGAYQEIMRMPI